MLLGMITLLACQIAGEGLVQLFGWSVPGAVMGMVILLITCLFTRRIGPGLQTASQGLLNHLALLYVPTGVGLVVHLGLIREHGLALLFILVVSTASAMVVTAWVYQRLAKPDELQSGG